MNEPVIATEEVRMGRKADRPYWVLMLSIFTRAAHQVGAGVFLASFLFNESLALPPFFLALVLVTGGMLLVTEGMRHRQFFRELIGVSTIVKLILLGIAVHGRIWVSFLVVAAFILASVCSHLPKKIRHRLIF
ncbi:MAG: hypothetical protein NDI81_13860 [Desulfobacula sp.]|nr:hypothetical protein [Desulfobacula sp.]